MRMKLKNLLKYLIFGAAVTITGLVIGLFPTRVFADNVIVDEWSSEYYGYSVESSIYAILSQNNVNTGKAMEWADYFMTKSKYRLNYLGGAYFPYDNNIANWAYHVTDGKKEANITGSKGCMAYCNWVSKLVHGEDCSCEQLSFPGNAGSYSASKLKSFLQKNLQMGEQIRLKDRHSLTFISCTTKGLYFLSYESFLSRINLVYMDYNSFADYINSYGAETYVYNACTRVNNKKPVANTSSKVSYSTADNAIQLSISTIDGAKTYKIYRKLANSTAKFKLVKTLSNKSSAKKLTYKDKNIKTSTEYQYKVVPYNGKYAAGSTTISAIQYKAPTMNSHTNVTNEGIEVSWKAVKNAYMYKVYRKVNNGSYKAYDTCYDNTFIDTNVKTGKSYTYKVTVCDYSNHVLSAKSKASAKTLVRKSPALKSITSTAKGVTLKWAKVSDVKYYQVLRKGDWDYDWTPIKIVAGTSYTDTNVYDYTNYTYSVRGVGNSKGTYQLTGNREPGLSIYYEIPCSTVKVVHKYYEYGLDGTKKLVGTVTNTDESYKIGSTYNAYNNNSYDRNNDGYIDWENEYFDCVTDESKFTITVNAKESKNVITIKYERRESAEYQIQHIYKTVYEDEAGNEVDSSTNTYTYTGYGSAGDILKASDYVQEYNYNDGYDYTLVTPLETEFVLVRSADSEEEIIFTIEYLRTERYFAPTDPSEDEGIEDDWEYNWWESEDWYQDWLDDLYS